MAKIWLTYAWSDNDDQDVDWVIQDLIQAGVEVRFDRARLLAGRRIWEQLADEIQSEDLDGLVLFVTESSLRSEPCQEELFYGLRRVLKAAHGRTFSLIGLFPRPIDDELVPPAIATRLYVNLTDQDWKEQIIAGLAGEAVSPDLTQASAYGHQWHEYQGKPVLEVWPKAGAWSPAFVMVPSSERAFLGDVLVGPRGMITAFGYVMRSEILSKDGGMKGVQLQNRVTAADTLHIFFNQRPTVVAFGSPQARYHLP